jgi:hypothetical protein
VLCVDFVDVDQEVLFELILAANYMDVKALLDLCCAKVASMMKGKPAEAIRKTFNIVNDFTPEEEEAIMAENKWCVNPSHIHPHTHPHTPPIPQADPSTSSRALMASIRLCRVHRAEES